MQRKQEEIARLKSMRTREVAAVGELAGDGLSKGAEWLHECILECAAEGNAQATAETAIDRRAGALAALSEHTGCVFVSGVALFALRQISMRTWAVGFEHVVCTHVLAQLEGARQRHRQSLRDVEEGWQARRC